MDLFITCGQALEEVLQQELIALGYPWAVTGFRGVSVSDVGLNDIYRINYLSRVGGRVLLPLARFYCKDDRGLYMGAGKIDWRDYIPSGKSIAIDANVNHTNIRNSLYAAQVVKDAICDQLRESLGYRPNVDVKNPDVQLNLYITDNRAILSFDTSGSSLNKRGYRQEFTEASMQENLAAALLQIGGFNGSEIFCDPCCGSGTLLIEAALMAAKIAPGFLRTKWGFQYLPEHSNEKWLKVKAEIDSQRVDLEPGKIFGADINKQAVHATKVNLRAAGLHRFVEVIQSDIRDYTPPTAPNFLMTNPPYGRRLDEDKQLWMLYQEIGDFMKQKMSKPSKGFVFTGNLDLAKEVGLTPNRRHVLSTGGLEARLLEFDVY